MAILGNLIHRAIRMRNRFDFFHLSPSKYQDKELKRLLWQAANTAFGRYYGFREILKSRDPVVAFQQKVPVFDYDKMHDEWWYRSLQDEPDVAWPGEVRYFALTSGTAGASSKRIPVTTDMVKAIRKVSIKQIFCLAAFDPPDEIFEKSILILGGSTHLEQRGKYFEGDMSGISTSQLPVWFQHYYKPGREISEERDWNKKLSEIVSNAPEWDVGIIAGVPSWVQILLQQIIDHYKLNNIHEMWPNLSIYVHGGVSFTPYKRGFAKLCGRPLNYMETYIASEGYIALQRRPGSDGMQMALNNGVFFEFVPFDSQNFDNDGNILPGAQALSVRDVKADMPYALLLSTCAGAWRYLIGDVVRFTDNQKGKIVIDGRTKHYLSLCGEHLSVDNMTRAVEEAEHALNINISEFTVAGVANLDQFAHHWFVGTNDEVDAEELKNCIDKQLQKLNDDYRIERSSALSEVKVDILPPAKFYEWMEKRGKAGGQNKFPRVLKGKLWEDWKAFTMTDA